VEGRGLAVARLQIAMALRAVLIGGLHQQLAPLVLDVAARARRRELLVVVMGRPGVTGRARVVAHPRPVAAGAHEARRGHARRGTGTMADLAVRLEHLVRGGDGAAVVDALIAPAGVREQPDGGQQGRRHREDEAPAAERVRALEVVERDALGARLLGVARVAGAGHQYLSAMIAWAAPSSSSASESGTWTSSQPCSQWCRRFWSRSWRRSSQLASSSLTVG